MGRPKCDRDGKIRAHPHRQQAQPVALGDLGRQGKVRRRRFVHRRQAHEAGNGEPIGCAAALQERVRIFRQDPGFLLLAPGIELHEQKRRPALSGDLARQRLAQ